MLHLGERSYGRPRHRGPRRDVKSSLDGHPFLLLSQCAKLGCGTAYVDAMTTAAIPHNMQFADGRRFSSKFAHVHSSVCRRRLI
jgi:hypothetical protein